MKYRRLQSELNVSSIGMGCMPMVGCGNIAYGYADRDESIATIRESIDLGVNFFDTAEFYGPFTNELLLGEAIKGRRDNLVVATKFAMAWDGNHVVGLDGSPENARRACEGSLTRLGIDVIDLFYLHRIDPEVAIEETIGGMAKLVEEGKVRHLGLSEASAETIRRAAKVHPIAALQSEYSIWERDVEDEILSTCRELGIAFIAYSPLGRGFLAGNIRSIDDLSPDDYRRNDPRYSPENLPRNRAIVEAVERVALRLGVSNAQVALSWLLAQGKDVVPIPGVKRRKTMRDSVEAADLTLNVEDVAFIAAMAPVGATAGRRYTDRGMEMIKI